MKYLLFLLFLGVGVTACNDLSEVEQQNAEKELWDVVMHGHDEVMPLTGELSKASRTLKNYMTEQEALDPTLRKEINSVVADMHTAEEEMFEWMANIKQIPDLRKEKSHKEIMKYLEDEKKTMEKIKEMTVSSLKRGKEMVLSLEPQ